ncbi:MAG TPA: ABC transporter permease [Solirubrobacteraceae bacterium]|nr:ABC transporter permease [Solirubrobacteraceae bacterium]
MIVGFGALYRRRLAVALNNPVAITGQLLLPVLWVLVVGPALARAFGGFSHVDYFTYIAVGQIVFIIPFSAMFAGLVVIQDRYAGILRELLVAPIRRSMIPLANVATVLTIAMGQLALIVVLSLIRGAHLHVAPGRLALGLLAAALLSVATYGLAELLAYRITQPQIFGTLIPAIGATPYALCGAIYPLATLPPGVKQFAYALPWTHAVAALRYGFMGGPASGLRAIWHLQSNIAMALLSIGVLAASATLTVGLALRAFERETLA